MKSLLKLIFSGVYLLFGFINPTAAYSQSDLKCTNQQDHAVPVIEGNFVKWVSSLPKNIAYEDLCETVEISSTQVVQNEKVLFHGQGSTFKSSEEPNKVFILTAAHVVADAKKLEVKCGGKTYQAKLRGISETTDLAVLVLEENPKEIKPLFVWDGKKLPVAEVRHNLQTSDDNYLPEGAHYIQTSADYVDPKNVHLIRLTNDGEKVISNRYETKAELVTNPLEHPLIGSKTAIKLPNQGIRPGMSGSPLLYSVKVRNWNSSSSKEEYVEKTFLSGVLVKTYINETQSTAVPLETINTILPFLMKGKDPAKLESAPYVFQKKEGIPTITFHTKSGDEQFQAICAGPFSNTSGKSGVGDSTGKSGVGDSTGKSGVGDSTGKSGVGDSTGKSGVGDSTGKSGVGDSTGKSGVGDSTGKGESSYYNSDSLTLYRDHYGCRETGIKDSKGNVYLAIKREDGTVAKAEAFEDVSDLIQKYGSEFPDYIKKNGLKSSEAEKMYEQFCSKENLLNQKVRIERRDFDPKNVNVARYKANGEVVNGTSFTNTDLEVKCDSKTKVVNVKAVKDDLKLNLTIRPGSSWEGNINFRGCQSKFKTQPESPWFARHKDENLDLEMSMSPDENFLGVNIFAANEKCLTKEKKKSETESNVWLSKINMSLPKKKFFAEKTEVESVKEKDLIKEDNRLRDEALAAISKKSALAEEILEKLHNNELEELEKERSGEAVSNSRIENLRLIISQLKFKLGKI